MTTAEMLAAAETALNNILTGQMQSYSINSKSYTLLNLNDLRDYVNELRQLRNEEQGTAASGSFSSIAVPSRFVNPFKGY